MGICTCFWNPETGQLEYCASCQISLLDTSLIEPVAGLRKQNNDGHAWPESQTRKEYLREVDEFNGTTGGGYW